MEIKFRTMPNLGNPDMVYERSQAINDAVLRSEIP